MAGRRWTSASKPGCSCLDGDVLAFRHELARLAVEAAVILGGRPGTTPGPWLFWRPTPGTVSTLPGWPGTPSGRATGPASTGSPWPWPSWPCAHAAHREAAAHYAKALSAGDGMADAERAALYDAIAQECHMGNDLEQADVSGRTAAALWQHVGDDRSQAVSLMNQVNAYMAMVAWVPACRAGAAGSHLPARTARARPRAGRRRRGSNHAGGAGCPPRRWPLVVTAGPYLRRAVRRRRPARRGRLVARTGTGPVGRRGRMGPDRGRRPRPPFPTAGLVPLQDAVLPLPRGGHQAELPGRRSVVRRWHDLRHRVRPRDAAAVLPGLPLQPAPGPGSLGAGPVPRGGARGEGGGPKTAAC